MTCWRLERQVKLGDLIVQISNELQTNREILRRIAQVPIEKEVVVVDDGSCDGTRDVLRDIESQREYPPMHIHFMEVNRGKGAAIREGVRHATGDVILI